MAELNLRRRVMKTHAKGVQQASHIMGGRSSSSSQKGFFRGSSFTSPFLSSTFSSTLSSTLCFSSSASTLQVWAVAGSGGGVSNGEERGSVTSVTEVLGVVESPSCFPSSSCLSLSPAHLGRVGALEGGAEAAATVTMLLKSIDKAKITRKYSSKGKSRLNHKQQKTTADLLSVCWNLPCCTSEHTRDDVVFYQLSKKKLLCNWVVSGQNMLKESQKYIFCSCEISEM